MPVPQRHRLRQVRPGPAGVPDLGPYHQCRRLGHAQVQATSRSVPQSLHH